MTVELFYDSRKTFLIAEKVIGVIILKQSRYVAFDFAIIKLPLLTLWVLTRLYSLMVKTRDCQHMGLLRKQVQNQWGADSMAVAPLLPGGLRYENRTYQYLFWWEADSVHERGMLKCLSPLGKSSSSLLKGWLGSTWWPMEWHSIL